MTAWLLGAKLDAAALAARLFGRRATDAAVRSLRAAAVGAAVRSLRAAAVGAAAATSQADLRKASAKIADAIQAIGIANWPRFVADAVARARDPETKAAIARAVAPASPPSSVSPTNLPQATRSGPVDDADRRRQIAHSFVQSGGSGTRADEDAVAEHLASVMTAAQLSRMKAAGVQIVVCRNSVTDYLTYIKGVPPRGYPRGAALDTVPGLGINGQVITSTHTGPNGSRERPGLQQSASADVTLHEAGHIINQQPFFDLLSDKDDFRQAYDKDAHQGPLADPYFHQPNASAGRDEAFAESHAEFFKQPDIMKSQYPNPYAYWERFYGAGK